MFFVSKRKYNELLKQKEDFEKLNNQLTKCNDALLVYVKELKKQRDMWRERAEEENRQVEVE